MPNLILNYKTKHKNVIKIMQFVKIKLHTFIYIIHMTEIKYNLVIYEFLWALTKRRN